MVCRHISDEVKEMVLSMSLQGLCDSKICELTGVSEHSIKWLSVRDGLLYDWPLNKVLIR